MQKVIIEGNAQLDFLKWATGNGYTFLCFEHGTYYYERKNVGPYPNKFTAEEIYIEWIDRQIHIKEKELVSIFKVLDNIIDSLIDYEGDNNLKNVNDLGVRFNNTLSSTEISISMPDAMYNFTKSKIKTLNKFTYMGFKICIKKVKPRQ